MYRVGITLNLKKCNSPSRRLLPASITSWGPVVSSSRDMLQTQLQSWSTSLHKRCSTLFRSLYRFQTVSTRRCELYCRSQDYPERIIPNSSANCLKWRFLMFSEWKKLLESDLCCIWQETTSGKHCAPCFRWRKSETYTHRNRTTVISTLPTTVIGHWTRSRKSRTGKTAIFWQLNGQGHR